MKDGLTSHGRLCQLPLRAHATRSFGLKTNLCCWFCDSCIRAVTTEAPRGGITYPGSQGHQGKTPKRRNSVHPSQNLHSHHEASCPRGGPGLHASARRSLPVMFFLRGTANYSPAQAQ